MYWIIHIYLYLALALLITFLWQVSCHLGNGCSAAVSKHGACLDTTMGFSPLEGLVMGQR